MKTAETIFDLVEKEEIPVILADKRLYRRFLELMDSDFLRFTNDRVVITGKGQRLRNSEQHLYPEAEDENSDQWMDRKEQLLWLRGGSLLVIGTWLMVLLYVLQFCRLRC